MLRRSPGGLLGGIGTPGPCSRAEEPGWPLKGGPCVGVMEIWKWGCPAGERWPARIGPEFGPRAGRLASELGASLAWAMARAFRG